MQKVVEDIAGNYDAIFSIGNTTEEEVSDIYQILKYINENEIEIQYGIAIGYSHDTKYQSKVDAFNKKICVHFNKIILNNI